MAELGYKDISFVEWLGWFAPTATPAAKVNALNAAVNAQLASPAMGEVFEKNALQALGGTSDLGGAHQARLRLLAPGGQSNGLHPED